MPETRRLPHLFCHHAGTQQRQQWRQDLPEEKDNPRYKVKPQDPAYEQGILALTETPEYYVSTAKDLDEYLLDDHGHLIVKHDLFNHDGLTKDGIAEAFAEFAKKEHLSFF